MIGPAWNNDRRTQDKQKSKHADFTCFEVENINLDSYFIEYYHRAMRTCGGKFGVEALGVAFEDIGIFSI